MLKEWRKVFGLLAAAKTFRVGQLKFGDECVSSNFGAADPRRADVKS
jgi:hypothetical protein